MASGDTKTQQYLDVAANGTRADVQHGCCETRTQSLIMDVADRIITEEETRAREDQILQGEIDEIKNNPDVADIVPTYAALQDYDTSTLTDKDIIRVLADETHGGASTYYRWNTSSETFTYVGEAGDYYTKNQVDTLLDGKQDELTAGENITIEDESGSLVISAAGGNYTAGDGINISVQDVISATNTGKAKVLTSSDYNWPTTAPDGVALWLIGPGIFSAPNGVKVYATTGESSSYGNKMGIVSGDGSGAYPVDIIYTNYADKTVLYTQVTNAGTIGGNEYPLNVKVANNLSTTTSGSALDARQGKVLKDLIDSIAIRGAGAPTTSTVGEVGQLYEDGTNGALYQLKSIDITTTPNTYTWEEVGAGGGPTVVQTTGTSTTDVMSQNAVTSMVFADPNSKQRIRIGNENTVSGNHSIGIGVNAMWGDHAASDGNIGIGLAAGPYSSGAITGTISLGARARATRSGEMNIGTDFATYGYNSSNYRLLSGVYDGQSAHDAATKGQLDSIAIQNAGAPTTSTVGSVGQLLEDTTNGNLYICTAIVPGTDPDPDTYTWSEVGAGGGGGIIELTSDDYNYPADNPTRVALWLLEPGIYYAGTGVSVRVNSTTNVANSFYVVTQEDSGYKSILVLYPATAGGTVYNVLVTNGAGLGSSSITTSIVQTTGTSTTDVMSQNAVTSMVFADPSNRYRIRIGDNATVIQNSSVTLGSWTSNYGAGGVVIGHGSSANGQGSIALGAYTDTNGQGIMNIGPTSASYGYNSSNYRLLTGLYDPQSAHDAATKGYVDSHGATLLTNTQFNQIMENA